jgi:hypothetical protein
MSQNIVRKNILAITIVVTIYHYTGPARETFLGPEMAMSEASESDI